MNCSLSLVAGVLINLIPAVSLLGRTRVGEHPRELRF